MPVTAESQQERKMVERPRGIIVGKYKTGKSWLLATAKRPVLFLDPDLRADSLTGKPGVFTLSFSEPPGIGQQPTVYNDILSVVGNLEKSKRLGSLHPKFEASPHKDEIVQSVCLDSAQSTSRAVLQYNMYANPKVLAREIVIGGRSLYFPSGYDAWNSDMECMEQLVARLVSMPDIDFWMSFHEDDKAEGSDITVYPRRHNPLIRYFNEAWRMTRKQNVPEAQLQPNFQFIACTTLIDAPGTVSNPNITELFEKYGRR